MRPSRPLTTGWRRRIWAPRRTTRPGVHRAPAVGAGLYSLYRGLADVRGVTVDLPDETRGAGGRPDRRRPAGRGGPGPVLRDLGSVAGDLALICGAQAASMSPAASPRGWPTAWPGGFRRRFEDKGRLSDYTRDILYVPDRPSLRGPGRGGAGPRTNGRKPPLTLAEILKLAPVGAGPDHRGRGARPFPGQGASVAGGLNALRSPCARRRPSSAPSASASARSRARWSAPAPSRRPRPARRPPTAGARFGVSPGLIEGEGFDGPAPLLPGVATATELMAGLRAGYTYFKLFPANIVGGVGALKAFSSPFPQATFCPTGGVDAKNAPDYLALPNVICVGGAGSPRPTPCGPATGTASPTWPAWPSGLGAQRGPYPSDRRAPGLSRGPIRCRCPGKPMPSEFCGWPGQARP